MKPLTPKDMQTIQKIDLKAPYVWIATWFGTGFLRPGPGTWGSLGSIPPAVIVYNLWGILGITLGIIIITLAGYYATKKFEAVTQEHDSKMIVVDEAAGQWIALFAAALLFNMSGLATALAFIVFRLFDILKPWPVSHFDQNVSGATGVMGDDIVAGTLTAIILLITYMLNII